jgi:hypothetical protein
MAAYLAVLGGAGAFPRDAVDRRIVGEVRNRSGHIRKTAGTIPPARSLPAEPDSDGDGMPDQWERRHGSQPTVADPWQDSDHDGIPNLDEFLDDAHRRLVSG